MRKISTGAALLGVLTALMCSCKRSHKSNNHELAEALNERGMVSQLIDIYCLEIGCFPALIALGDIDMRLLWEAFVKSSKDIDFSRNHMGRDWWGSRGFYYSRTSAWRVSITSITTNKDSYTIGYSVYLDGLHDPPHEAVEVAVGAVTNSVVVRRLECGSVEH